MKLVERPCPKCRGTGEDWSNVDPDSGALNGEDCPTCGGDGTVAVLTVGERSS